MRSNLPNRTPIKYRPALRLFGAVLAIELVCVAALNIAVNPYGLYPTRWVRPLVSDDHTAKLELLRVQRPRLLVLGSSRVQKLEPAYLERRTGLPAFNLGMSSGLTEDSLCLFCYATEALGLPVERVILGVDVDSFHPTAPVNPALLQDSRLRRYLPTELHPGFPENIANFAQALTLDQSIASLRALAPRPSCGATRFDPDGFLHHAAESRSLDIGQDMRRCTERFDDFSHLSATRLRCLDDLATRCRVRGIRLTVFVTTVHDQYARATAATYTPRYWELIPQLRARAARGGYSFYDCSHISRYGGDPNDFYDISHIKVGNARRIIDHVIP